MFHADTGLYLGGASGRVPDLHIAKNKAVFEASRERIRWAGPVKTYNPRAEAMFHHSNDAFLLGIHTGLGAAPGGPVDVTALDTVVAELPGEQTKDKTLDELVTVLDRSKETQVPVKTNGSVLRALLANWPAVRQVSKVKSLSEVFANEKDDYVMMPDHLIRAVSQVTK